jgi:hypothetical protein
MKKTVMGRCALCGGILMGSTVFIASSDYAEQFRDNFTTYAIGEFQRGISVEKSTQNGTYLRFDTEDVAIKFADYLSNHYSNVEEIERIMKPFYAQGFISRTRYEEREQLPFEEWYSIGAWGYLVNQEQYFKIGNILYYDENQKKLYTVDKKSEKKLLKERMTKEESVSCPNGGYTGEYFYVYPEEPSLHPTIRMETSMQHTTPFFGAQELVLSTKVSIKQPNHDTRSPTPAAFSHQYTYDI